SARLAWVTAFRPGFEAAFSASGAAAFDRGRPRRVFGSRFRAVINHPCRHRFALLPCPPPFHSALFHLHGTALSFGPQSSRRHPITPPSPADREARPRPLLAAMFDLFAMVLSSIASFLFPIFASYKALKTSDPAQLTPWLMYWVVFSCCLLVESWVSFVLVWVPFYGYIRLLFLLYLILPQTQGARVIYEENIHPFLENNEASIDDFIASAHERLKAAGITYLREAIEYLKTNLLGLPPTEQPPASEPTSAQGYTQSLLARFSVPTARWAGAANTGSEFYNFVAGAVSAAASAGGGAVAGISTNRGTTGQGTLIPPNLRDSADKMNFIAAQRERLNIVLSALDREAQEVQRSDAAKPQDRGVHPGAFTASANGQDEEEATQRPPSGLSMWSALSKSRSETDFEKVEAESGAEDDGSLRRRHAPGSGNRNSWVPWGFGSGADADASSAREE
ncbi:Protein YOP1, partial [Tolypocladium capitatum]